MTADPVTASHFLARVKSHVAYLQPVEHLSPADRLLVSQLVHELIRLLLLVFLPGVRVLHPIHHGDNLLLVQVVFRGLGVTPGGGVFF